MTHKRVLAQAITGSTNNENFQKGDLQQAYLQFKFDTN